MEKEVEVKEVIESCGGTTTVVLQGGQAFTLPTKAAKDAGINQGAKLKVFADGPDDIVSRNDIYLANLH